MNKTLSISTLALLIGCLVSQAQLPDISKIFDRNETFLVSKSENKGRPIYSLVTNEEFDTLKAKLLKAMGEDWKEIKRFDAGHKTGPTGKKRQDKSVLIGDIRLANPKQPKNHLIMAVFNTPNTSYDTKYSMMILIDEAPPKQD
ncbi:hypothetical protein N9A94_04135 [Akkermansiaceae bacterium]|nr:hypothetical protein [Akkermansiaceae bacterium]